MSERQADWNGPWVREPSVVHKGWIVDWHLRPIIVADQDAEDSATVAFKASQMHAHLEYMRLISCEGRWKDDEEIAEISDEFHTIGHVDGDESASVKDFNLVLEALYDWADTERVII